MHSTVYYQSKHLELKKRYLGTEEKMWGQNPNFLEWAFYYTDIVTFVLTWGYWNKIIHACLCNIYL